jgi:hypothetical protein
MLSTMASLTYEGVVVDYLALVDLPLSYSAWFSLERSCIQSEHPQVRHHVPSITVGVLLVRGHVPACCACLIHLDQALFMMS